MTVEDVLFNKVELVDINFFSQNSDVPFVKTVKENVAKWYVVIRNIAIIGSLCVLLYIGIRMVLSTVAEEKAEYKNMFRDWFVSFVLIFVLHYIMLLCIYGNNAIVDALGSVVEGTGNQITTFITDMKEIRFTINPNENTLTVSEKFGANMVCLMLAALTCGFLFMYLKRAILIAFLIMIAPIITITYSIDKIGDKSAQALNTWIKEFFWTILIQPFHCLIYMVLVTTSISVLQGAKSFTAAILAIFCLYFVFQAEKIVKKIFNIDADDVGSLGGATAIAGIAGVGAIASMAKTAAAGKSAVNKLRGAGKKDSNSAGSGSSTTPPPTTPDSGSGGAGAAALAGAGAAAAGAAAGAAQNAAAGAANAGNTSNTTSTQNKNNEKNSWAQRAANMVDSPAIQKARGMLDSVVKSYPVTTGAAKFAGKMAAEYVKLGIKAGGALAGIGLAALDDNASLSKLGAAGIAGGAVANIPIQAGEGIYNNGKSKLDALVARGRIENKERDFEHSYNNYKSDKENVGKTAEQIADRAKNLLRIDLSSEIGKSLSDTERQFAQAIQNLKNQYSTIMDDKDAEDRTIDSINRLYLKDTQNIL